MLNTIAITLRTLVLDDFSFTITGRTNTLCLHHAKDALLLLDNHTRTMTGRTCLKPCATTSMTAGAGDILTHLELLGDTSSDLLQIQAYLQAQIGATMYLWVTSSEATKATASEAAAEARMSSKDISEHREDIIHRESCSTTKAFKATASEATRTIEAKLVVLLTLLIVGQHRIRLCCLLELLFCLSLLSIALVTLTVRMVFDGYLTISLLYICCTGFLVNTKYLVIISLCHFTVLLLLLRNE